MAEAARNAPLLNPQVRLDGAQRRKGAFKDVLRLLKHRKNPEHLMRSFSLMRDFFKASANTIRWALRSSGWHAFAEEPAK
jgi:hypothetical protein